MVLNSIDPQSMTSAQVQLCKNCGKRVSETDKVCSSCKKDLSEVGRHISLTLTDPISISDYLKLSKKDKEQIPSENIRWDPETLTFFGVMITVFFGCTSFVISTTKLSLLEVSLSSLLITLLLFILITKVKIIRYILVRAVIWFLNKNNEK